MAVIPNIIETKKRKVEIPSVCHSFTERGSNMLDKAEIPVKIRQNK